jgi:hypothetical protein
MPGFGELVRAYLVPCIEGFYRANGTVRRVDYDGPQLSWFRLGPLSTPDRAYHPDDMADVDRAARALLADGQGSVCCGEGPMGADGSTFTNNMDRSVVIDLDQPDFAA